MTSSGGSLLSWEELSKKEYRDPEFLLDPYIPRGGIVFFYAPTSIGKSPLTWHMARAVGEGKHFFGLPTKEGRVLYLELDTPEPSIAKRIQKIEPARNVWFLFSQPLSIPNVTSAHERLLREAQATCFPDLVVVNTLRKAHRMDDKDSLTPVTVYAYFQALFPQAALLFVHHTKKVNPDPRVPEVAKEAFSGAMNWMNDAQVGLHLEPYKGSSSNLRLSHRKSQVSELLKPLPLLLERDGSTLRSPLFEELRLVYDFLSEGKDESLTRNEVDVTLSRLLSERMGYAISSSTAKRRRCAVEGGAFPGSRAFLSPSPDEFSDLE